MAEDLLFATLDPTMRQIALPGLDKAILSDTVGFVSDLPTQLIAAFRATLEEVLSADLIVHVRDIAHPDSDAQRDDVIDVLSELGVAGEGALSQDGEAHEPVPMIEAWNKLDLLDADAAVHAREIAARRDDVVILSALTGAGVEALQRAISVRLTAGASVHSLSLPVSDGAAMAWLHENGEVLSSRVDEDMIHVEARLSDSALARFSKRDR
jgi:GTP-binding protein HflX